MHKTFDSIHIVYRYCFYTCSVFFIQIQDAANYIKEACECLVEIQGGKQTCKNPENIEKPKKDPSQIRKGFEVLTSSLRRAESALVLPKPITAVQIYNGEQKVWDVRVLGYII